MESVFQYHLLIYVIDEKPYHNCAFNFIKKFDIERIQGMKRASLHTTSKQYFKPN